MPPPTTLQLLVYLPYASLIVHLWFRLPLQFLSIGWYLIWLCCNPPWHMSPFPRVPNFWVGSISPTQVPWVWPWVIYPRQLTYIPWCCGNPPGIGRGGGGGPSSRPTMKSLFFSATNSFTGIITYPLIPPHLPYTPPLSLSRSLSIWPTWPLIMLNMGGGGVR